MDEDEFEGLEGVDQETAKEYDEAPDEEDEGTRDPNIEGEEGLK